MVHDAFEDASFEALGAAFHVVELLATEPERSFQRRHVRREPRLLPREALVLGPHADDVAPDALVLVSQVGNAVLESLLLVSERRQAGLGLFLFREAALQGDNGLLQRFFPVLVLVRYPHGLCRDELADLGCGLLNLLVNSVQRVELSKSLVGIVSVIDEPVDLGQRPCRLRECSQPACLVGQKPCWPRECGRRAECLAG